MIEALKRNWWVLVIRGICGIVFGVVAFVYPGLALATLVILFGAWVLIDGVFRIVGATAGSRRCRRLPHIPRARNNRADTGHLHRRLGAHDRGG